MRVWSFLLDRSLYIALYLGFGAVTVIIVQLDMVFSGASLRLVNIAYLMLLGIVGLAAFLAIDYRRHMSFCRRLERIGADEPLDNLGFLADARTLEQRIFSDAWSRLYARLTAEIVEERTRGRQNVHVVSQWAHYMKGPVSVMDLELQKAAQIDMSSELAERLRSVSEENQRLNDSLQMLLNMVRLEDFSTDLQLERVDLLALVRQLINDNRRMFISHGVFPKISSADQDEDGWPHVVTDSKWLRFVLQQVISNAIKYSASNEREGQVAFSCRKGKAEGESVLEIADNGIGIPPEDLDRVFAPFFTGVNGRLFPQSTGMGLYLAQQACNRLGHRIDLESSRGEGTRVFVHFFPDSTMFAGIRPGHTLS